jgi:hypothetical protein
VSADRGPWIDLDGNYRPVLTSYHQLADLAGLLRDRRLAAAHIRQVLGGNAADLLNRIGSSTYSALKDRACG